MEWFDSNSELFARERAALAQQCPGLEPLAIYLNGVGSYRRYRIPVAAARGWIAVDPTISDSPAYEVAIVCPPDYPTQMPDLFCVDRLFRRGVDYHIYRDGTACLCLRLERRRWWTPGSTLVDFVTRLVLPFLNFQHCKRLGHEYPFGERKHGLNGIYQGLTDMVGFSAPEQLDRFIQLLLQPNTMRDRQTLCPCGSGKKLNSCHQSEVHLASLAIDLGGLVEDLRTCGHGHGLELLKRSSKGYLR